jgi:hypothetical protein
MITLNTTHTGFTKDIKIEFGSKNWSPNSLYDINSLLSLYKLKEIISLYKDYEKLINQLNTDNVNFKLMLGNKLYKEKLLEIKKILNSLTLSQYRNYTSIIEKRIQFTQSFKEIYLEETIISPGKYDHFTSQTGRVKIKNTKNNFLTMKRESRSRLQSTYVNGRVYAIDIVSLEPRVYMHINKEKVQHDVYSQIKKELSINADRKNVKLAIISALYSGSVNTIKKISGLSKDQVKSIIEYFDIEKFTSELKDRGDNIKNFYDRPLKQNQAILNHYIQSTSADCALLAFNKLQSEWYNKKINFCAFIHDAVIVDVHPDHFKDVENLKLINECILNIELPVSIERLS